MAIDDGDDDDLTGGGAADTGGTSDTGEATDVGGETGDDSGSGVGEDDSATADLDPDVEHDSARDEAAALQAEAANDPDRPAPDDDVDPETGDPAGYPDEKKGAATEEVGSDHPAVAVANLEGQVDAARAQQVQVADTTIDIGQVDAHNAETIEGEPVKPVPEQPRPDAVDALGSVAVAAGGAATVAKHWWDNRGSKGEGADEPPADEPDDDQPQGRS
ncbi:hypothetical protein [Virgisporangium aurantiacum]|uniref:Uncharacterized protein n=1 Tax=Virgisporangium aurantiacum TaxID=175570 RepID=A0A8J3ZG74_9ACTN|nr:hypothetical protein [Virgisporangium aurantiacum]GIJ63542.1 hypothetical protein Vau01_110580 [Virgisporangium aurantiacum]